MKMGKRAATVCALIVGAALLATSALADVMIGSGYNTFKDSIKTTAAALTGEVDSFTMEMTSDVKLDGESINYQNGITKVDVKADKMESESKSVDRKHGSNQNYSYVETGRSINKYSDSDTYYVVERDNTSVMDSRISNPFEEERTADFEKIVDAMVGNLKDVIQIEESDSKKMFVGNLTEAQVPALINAVLSFGVKHSIGDYTAKEYGIPSLVSDIYVTEASGKAIANADGILENVIGKGAITGKDKDGVEHSLTVELAATVTDIGTTTVQAPNLEGKTVEYMEHSESRGLSQKYIGTYKADIVEDKKDSLEKIGERVMEITAIDGETVTGKYYETYKDGVEPKEEPLSFDFTGSSQKYGYSFEAFYADAQGETKTLSVRSDGGIEGESVYLELDRVQLDDGYSVEGGCYSLKRVFE